MFGYNPNVCIDVHQTKKRAYGEKKHIFFRWCFSSPFHFVKEKTHNNTPFRRCMWTKVIWDFVHFFRACYSRDRKLPPFFYIVIGTSLTKNTQTLSFTFKWTEIRLKLKMCLFRRWNRQTSRALRQQMLRRLLFIKQTNSHLCFGSLYCRMADLFCSVRCVCWHGKKLPGGRQIHDLNLCNWKWPSIFSSLLQHW